MADAIDLRSIVERLVGSSPTTGTIFMKSQEEIKKEIIEGNLDKIDNLSDIVTVLESYLSIPSLDGRTARQGLRKQMQEMLDNL